MELASPAGLALLLALVPALWLARRASGRSALHPLWFLVPAGGAHGRRHGGARRGRWLLVIAIGLLAIAAAAPLARESGGARVLVVDLSATRARDLEAVRARIAGASGGYDEVVLARPGAAPLRMSARGAAAVEAAKAIVPGNGMVDAAGIAAAVEAALPGAREIELASAPGPGDDVGIARVGVHRDPLRAARARIVVELVVSGSRRLPRAVVARAADGTVRGQAIPVRAGAGGFAVIELEGGAGGGGGETLTVAIEPAGADELAIDDVATVPVPPLGPAAVWIAPELERSAVARALGALATATGGVQRIDAPQADAIAVVASTAWRGPARARLVVSTPAAGAPVEPLLAVPGAPLPGLSAELLASTAPVAVDAAAGEALGGGGGGAAAAADAADAARVWLRAGGHPAVWEADDDGAPVLRLAAAIDGPALPVILADALVAPPLAPRVAPPTVVSVGEPAVAPGLPAPPAGRRQSWPLTVLLLAASIAIAIEAALGRPRGVELALRLAAIASAVLLATRGLRPPPRRVAFVLDVSDSVDGAAARAAVAARTAALASGDRASLTVVAGGARDVVPLGPPSAVAAWVRTAPLDRTAPGRADFLAKLGLEPGRTELGAGLALAGAALGGAGGELVLVGDGRGTSAAPGGFATGAVASGTSAAPGGFATGAVASGTSAAPGGFATGAAASGTSAAPGGFATGAAASGTSAAPGGFATGAAASGVASAPALIGRGFDLVAIDDGDLVRLDAPLAPLPAVPGRALAVPLTITSRAALPATVTITSRGVLLARRTVSIPAGRTSLAIPVTIPGERTGHPERSASDRERGVERVPLASLDLSLSVPGELITVDDRATVELITPGIPRTWRVDAASVASLSPSSLASRLAATDLLILDDIPAAAVSPAAPAIADFVADGGTLLWSAGPGAAASGAGALTSLLPLRPAGSSSDHVALLLLVDRSGSIEAAGRNLPLPGPADLAAAAAALEPDDLFGAFAFDVAPLPWLPLAPVSTARPLGPLPDARGGTDPTAALVEAGRQLAAAPSGARRIAVLISDGGFPASAAAATAAAAALSADGIRVEVIAAGSVDADARVRLLDVATAGGGQLHELATDLGAALPALRRPPATPRGPAVARARATWTTILGDLPASLLPSASAPSASATLADHLPLSPSPDAVVLADVGDDPLLAARRSGAGLVLAWSSDLGAAWSPPPLAAELVAAVTRAASFSSTEISVTASTTASGPPTLDVRVLTLSDEPPTALTVEPSTGPPWTIPLLPVAPGVGVARLSPSSSPAPAASAITLSAGATRVRVVPPDPERAHLGVDPITRSLVRPPAFEPATNPPRRLILWISAAIILLLLSLRRTNGRRTRSYQ